MISTMTFLSLKTCNHYLIVVTEDINLLSFIIKDVSMFFWYQFNQLQKRKPSTSKVSKKMSNLLELQLYVILWLKSAYKSIFFIQ